MSKPDHAGGPVDRIELLGAIIDDERVRLIHIRTARHILKRYYQKHGNARASVSFLQQATGLTRGSVASATEDLVAWGYFTRVMGSGKRPTEYHPNFSVLQSPDVTSVLPPQDETKSSVLQPQEQTLLLGSATARDKVKETPAPGTGHGLSATPFRASVDRVVRIVQSEVHKDEDDDSIWLYLQFEGENGIIEPYAICLQSDDQGMQERGQARLERLVIALGLNGLNQPSDVIGIPMMLTAKDDFKSLDAA